MKPSFNVNVDRTDKGLKGYRWNYRERKVGVYLTLHCPLQTRVTERRVCGAEFLAWVTTVWVQPRGWLEVRRDTHLYDAKRGRRLYTEDSKEPLWHQSYADFREQRTWTDGAYVPVKDLGNGLVRERWVQGPSARVEGTEHVDHVRWRGWEAERTTVGPPAGFDPVAYRDDVLGAVAGCAAQGRFDVLLDWFIENSPDCVADLFSNPGPL